MTELAPSPAADVVAQRLEMLERWVAERTAAAPRAAPPITIGPYANVPAPGSPIRSDWPQQLTTDVNKHVMTRVGVGVFMTASVGAGSNLVFPWSSEAYDTHNFHAANGTDLVIPSGWDGVFAATISVTTSPAVAGGSGLVRLALPGGAIKQTIIPAGQSISTTAYVGPLAGGQIAQGTFWNGGTAAVTATASMELLRVAL